MPNYTSNYNLTKPFQQELYDVDVFNENAEKIDVAIKEAKTSAEKAIKNSETNAKNLDALKNFTPDPLDASGKIVQIDLYHDAPLNVTTTIKPIQAGENDPSTTNIRPITGWTSARLIRCGNNIIWNDGLDTFTSGGVTYTRNDDGSLTLTGSRTGNSYYNLIGSISDDYQTQKIIFPDAPIYRNLPYGVGMSARTTDGDYVVISNGGNYSGYKFGALYLSVYEAAEIGEGLVVQPAVSLDANYTWEGLTAIPYSVEFDQTVYGGSYNWNTGLLTIDKAVLTLTGNESGWSNDSGWANSYVYSCSGLIPSSVSVDGYFAKADLLCSHASVCVPNDLASIHMDGVAQGNGNTRTIYLDLGTHASTAEFKSYLSSQYAAGTPVQIIYPLATPMEVHLTPQELCATENITTVYCDTGDSYVYGRNDILWLTHFLAGKVNSPNNVYTKEEIDNLLANIKFTIDNVVTPSGTNPVTSAAIVKYVAEQIAKITNFEEVEF